MDVAEVEARIEAFLARDDWSGAVEAAFRGYGEEVLRYIVTLLRDRNRADGPDLASELFLALLERRSQFQRRSPFRGFMYGIARNLAISALRGASRRPAVSLDAAPAGALVREVRDSTNEWQKTTTRDALAEVRAGLDVEEQTLLVLIVDRKLSSAEVAQAMSDPGRVVTPAAVRKRFERLREKLREKLEARGITVAGRSR
jgi:RNA polymerase sigma factor (sigma-70 family)